MKGNEGSCATEQLQAAGIQHTFYLSHSIFLTFLFSLQNEMLRCAPLNQSSADPEGGGGGGDRGSGPPPPGKSQVMWVSIRAGTINRNIG